MERLGNSRPSSCSLLSYSWETHPVAGKVDAAPVLPSTVMRWSAFGHTDPFTPLPGTLLYPA